MKSKSNLDKIDIVMTTDENYILQTRVTIWSMAKASAAEYEYRIHVLCDGALSPVSRNKLLEMEYLFDNISIHFIEVERSIFEKSKLTSFYTMASYYRLIMTEVIEAEKCVFLDGDIIVRTDISELFQTDLEGSYIAGVPDCGIKCRLERFLEHQKIINLPTMDKYVNAGVLVWNLKKMREDNLYLKFLSYIGEGYPSMDNDILNKCCYGKIKLLNIKYNFFAEFFGREGKLKEGGYSEGELHDLNENEMIIHFSGRFKPWEYVRVNRSEIWWNAAREALAESDYVAMYDAAKSLSVQSDWSYLLEKIRQYKDIIIVGFSDIGKNVADALLWREANKIGCFCDNDRKKQGKIYKQKEVLSIEGANENYPCGPWIITSQNYHREIKKQLEDMGIGIDRIIRYVDKSEAYYEAVDDRYQELEEKEKVLRTGG